MGVTLSPVDRPGLPLSLASRMGATLSPVARSGLPWSLVARMGMTPSPVAIKTRFAMVSGGQNGCDTVSCG
jgi:hypothetical protein